MMNKTVYYVLLGIVVTSGIRLYPNVYAEDNVSVINELKKYWSYTSITKWTWHIQEGYGIGTHIIQHDSDIYCEICHINMSKDAIYVKRHPKMLRLWRRQEEISETEGTITTDNIYKDIMNKEPLLLLQPGDIFINRIILPNKTMFIKTYTKLELMYEREGDKIKIVLDIPGKTKGDTHNRR